VDPADLDYPYPLEVLEDLAILGDLGYLVDLYRPGDPVVQYRLGDQLRLARQSLPVDLVDRLILENLEILERLAALENLEVRHRLEDLEHQSHLGDLAGLDYPENQSRLENPEDL